MLSFTELDPGVSQSGDMERKGQMVKMASSYLRCAILKCCDAGTLHNKIFAQYYSKKLQRRTPMELSRPT